ncbi:tetratricopeptide repeat protein [Nocardiopsis changdeensis]|uniref:Tetratricopeptide repeat protein n=1 Tax=Nocardiopsis changdeensis TaxID=2831969 RepID=A0ABX8BZY6_9ACTN|nr:MULTISPECIES: tetratricopeptide repeat protein [Nocardiopsis]QUX25898.1 tetratricopeptide repeat protein [Nocardiopsis changdeensis]QYX40368.1 tetratricopeptide repeat protein [Nocardiopsis sp. MT53]
MSFWRSLFGGTGRTRTDRVRSVDGGVPSDATPVRADVRGVEASDALPSRITAPTAVITDPSREVPGAGSPAAGPGGAGSSAQPAPTAGMRAASLERTLRSLVERLGTEHPDTITARNNLATKYAQMGRRQAAVQQFELALDEAVAVFGTEHPRTEIIRENLAWAFEDAGRPADAAAQWEVLLRDRESAFGPSDEDTVEARSRLAVCYRRSGRLDAAMAHYERALADVQDAERSEDLRLGLSAAQNMAGRHDEAVRQLRMVLAGRRRRMGKGHLDTLTVHHRLGRAYTQAGRTDEAVETLRDAYRVALNSSGDPEVRRLTLRLRRDLAGAYSAAGRHREADALF